MRLGIRIISRRECFSFDGVDEDGVGFDGVDE